MQASLCLQTTGPHAKNQYCRLALRHARPVLLRHPCHLVLNFSPLFSNGLWVGPSRRLISIAMRAHITPPEDDVDHNRAEEARRGTAKSAAAAAVVLACTLVAMCTSWKARAYALDGWPFSSRPPITSDDASTSTSMQTPTSTPRHTYNRNEDSIQALREIFDWKYDSDAQKPAPTPQILFKILDYELLPDEIAKLKKYLDQLKNKGETKAATNSLFDEWKKTPNDSDKYHLGLVLIDLLIIQGDYKRADDVCKKIQQYASKLDVRPKIRRAILDLANAIESEVKETEKAERLKRKMESTVRELIEGIQGSGGPPC